MAERTARAALRSSRREPVLAALLPVERLLFAGELTCVGTFRCSRDHPLFRGGLPSTSCCFVFPRTSVFIQHEGRRRFLADPTLVTFYNRGDVYRRFALSDEGDHADWFALAPDVLLEAVRARDPGSADRSARPFRFERGPCEAGTYLAQRTLLEALARAEDPDAFVVEESVFQLLDRVLGRVYAAHATGRRQASDADCVELARAFLARYFREPLALSSVAAAAGVSVPHLCRCFRQRTGRTLSAHRQQLRLRASLERVAAGEDLSALALDLGFSSHSHFTLSFRRAFGMTPSDARGRARRRLAELSLEINRTLAARN
jgi:AraC family transcriptional regulator